MMVAFEEARDWTAVMRRMDDYLAESVRRSLAGRSPPAR